MAKIKEVGQLIDVLMFLNEPEQRILIECCNELYDVIVDVDNDLRVILKTGDKICTMKIKKLSKHVFVSL